MGKRIRFMLLACLALALAFALVGCGDSEEKQRQEACVKQISAGLDAEWEASSLKIASFAEKGKSMLDGLEAELDTISDISAEDFSDEEFRSLFEKYKEALQNQIKGIEGYPSDASLYNSLYVDEGQIVRSACLKEFSEKYGLKASNESRQKKLEKMIEQKPIYMLSAGESALATSSYGDIEFAPQRMVVDSQHMGYARENEVREDQNYCILECVVTNVDYVEYDQSYVSIDKLVFAKSVNGVTIPPLGIAYEYAGYKSAAGAFTEIGQGQTLKVAIPYAMDVGMKDVEILVNPDHFIVLPIEGA